MQKQEFINKILPKALEGLKKYNILPSITIAQAILESNWGKSSLSMKFNNLFGIKARSNTRKAANMKTTEYINGKKLNVTAKFKSYDTFIDSISDHNILLGEAKRYERVRNSKDYKEAAMALQKCGYATDPKYPDKLIKIIEQYKLYEYDNEVSDFATKAYEFVTKNHISDGSRAKNLATREEIWVMIYRLYKLLNKK
ncbi:glycoside hydrolase family 73 protein [Tepidibacter mesophilus]|uniref:glycoside hydrolase family 73 protein n=1 Tax=Tepidibacter mesophilus TaxID=655607 RepID=UPI000C084916|nr:glycoside hydrolase family 73 protein [Tepidibacter mesophilus]